MNETTKQITHILLVRHGRTAWNHEERFRGRANIELDEVGEAQAEATAKALLAAWEIDAVYCSPLRRARQTAEAIANPLILHARPHPGLLDIDYGAWEGLTIPEVRQRWASALETWLKSPQLAYIPGGETLKTVRLRASGALREIAERHQGQTVVIVAHTVVNRLLLMGAFDIDNQHFHHFGQDPGGLNLLTYDGDAYTLLKMNDTSHLTAIEES